jgi:hypothetical protein
VKTGVLLYCGRQDGLDLGGEHRIGQCYGRAAALPVGLRLATAVHTRPGHPPDPADPRQAIVNGCLANPGSPDVPEARKEACVR